MQTVVLHEPHLNRSNIHRVAETLPQSQFLPMGNGAPWSDPWSLYVRIVHSCPSTHRQEPLQLASSHTSHENPMKPGIKTLITSFVAMWAMSYFLFKTLGDWQTANNIGGSYGAVSALLSGLALAMAIYSMVLQQKQAHEFEKNTLNAEKRTIEVLTQQSQAIALLDASLKQQVHAGRVAALTFLVERQELRIETLREWGSKSFGDEKHYQKGIDAANRKIEGYERDIRRILDAS